MDISTEINRRTSHEGAHSRTVTRPLGDHPRRARRRRRPQAPLALVPGHKREAQKECARLITEIERGTAVEPSRQTVAAFLEKWIEHMSGQVSPRSHERYSELCRKNLVPLLGAFNAHEIAAAPAGAGTARAGCPRASCGKPSSRPCAGRCSPATLPTPSSRPSSSAARCQPMTSGRR